MNKSIFIVALWVICVCASAQNIQMHYDFGHSLGQDLTGRPSVTTTVEMFRPDKWGNTFFFVDLDYQRDGVAGAYWEISREFDVSGNKQWAAHVEYDGGLSSDENTWAATRFQHTALVGPAWNWHSNDFRRTFSVQALYRHSFRNNHMEVPAKNSFQLTGVWGLTFADNLLSFSGYADMWYDKNVSGKWIFQSEPQFWVNLRAVRGIDVPVSIGTEVEISNNFVYNDRGENNRFYAIPTLGVKWTF